MAGEVMIPKRTQVPVIKKFLLRTLILIILPIITSRIKITCRIQTVVMFSDYYLSLVPLLFEPFVSDDPVGFH